MKCYQSTKDCFFITMLLISAALISCTKNSKRHYDLLPPDPEVEKDLTQLATGLTVNIENPGGPNAKEGSSKVTDGNIDTKFLIFSYDTTCFIELDFDIAQHLDAYTLTSADDADGRDPKDWQIVASNDS
ncbi:hypothetical protein, partial [Chitinophaga arvensicola]